MSAKRIIFAVIALFLGSAGCGATPSTPSQPPAVSPDEGRSESRAPTVSHPIDLHAALAKGINFNHIFDPWWEASTPYTEEDHKRIAASIREEDFALVSRLGFTHIRLNVGLTFLQDRRPPFALRPDFLVMMDSALDLAAKHRLAVILDMHQDPVPNLAGDAVQMQAFRTMWRALAARYASRDQPILFELLNEPRVEDSGVWRGIVRTLVADIREVDSDRTIVVTGGGWGGIDDLVALGNLHMPNLVYTFHFYDPMAFTHQGAEWTSAAIARLRGIRYPLNPAQMQRELESARKDGLDEWPFDGLTNGGGREALLSRLQPAFDFAEREGLVVYCGEFGVQKPYVPVADRACWIKDVRELLEQHGVGWSLWHYQGSMDIFAEDGRPTPEVINALGLRMPEPLVGGGK